MSSAQQHRLFDPICIPRQRDAPEPILSTTLESFTVADGATTTALFFAGELDTSSAVLVCDALERLSGTDSSNYVVDLSAVEFCSISCFAALAETARTAASQGRHFTVVASSVRLSRVCALLWPDRYLTRHETFAAAIADIRARYVAAEPARPLDAVARRPHAGDLS